MVHYHENHIIKCVSPLLHFPNITWLFSQNSAMCSMACGWTVSLFGDRLKENKYRVVMLRLKENKYRVVMLRLKENKYRVVMLRLKENKYRVVMLRLKENKYRVVMLRLKENQYWVVMVTLVLYTGERDSKTEVTKLNLHLVPTIPLCRGLLKREKAEVRQNCRKKYVKLFSD